MTTLLFLLSFFTLFVLSGILAVKGIRRKPVKSTVKIMGFVAGGYLVLWTAFYFISDFTPIALGTDVCFDDWCATVTQIEKGALLKAKLPSPVTDSAWVILHVKMSNHARGIAQKPSEPRIHLTDGKGAYWPYSAKGQRALDVTAGKQAGIDSRLELHQSLETQLVFEVPSNAKDLKVLIEEGPFITKLLFPEDQQVFRVP